MTHLIVQGLAGVVVAFLSVNLAPLAPALSIVGAAVAGYAVGDVIVRLWHYQL